MSRVLSLRFIRIAVVGWLLSSTFGLSQSAIQIERRIIDYLRDNLKAGEPVIVTKLYNEVFTSVEERKALDRLYNIFFKVPIFVAEYYANSQKAPTLREISQQFNLSIDGEVDVILKIAEFDRRVPRFISRDPQTGEITKVDIDKIKSDPRFNKVIERSIAGWEGKVAPPFKAQLLNGEEFKSADLRGNVHLVYFWFTHCPPCVKITPHLVSLQEKFRSKNFKVVGLNADTILELGYTDEERKTYLEENKVNFAVAHLTTEIQSDYGGVQLFPTLFLVDKEGIIRGHFVNYQEESTLQKAIESVL